MMETVSLVIRSDTGKFEIVHSNTRRIDVKFSWIFGDLSLLLTKKIGFYRKLDLFIDLELSQIIAVFQTTLKCKQFCL